MNCIKAHFVMSLVVLYLVFAFLLVVISVALLSCAAPIAFYTGNAFLLLIFLMLCLAVPFKSEIIDVILVMMARPIEAADNYIFTLEKKR